MENSKGGIYRYGWIGLLGLLGCDTTPAPLVNTEPHVYAEASYTVSVTSGIAYGEGLSHEAWGSGNTTRHTLLLDVYEPEDAPANRPAMILIHGGGFQAGSRTHPALVEHAHYFAARGWVVFSIGYRLLRHLGTVPEAWQTFADQAATAEMRDVIKATYPAGRDAKAAVRWVYAHAEEYQLATDYITVLGGSAGAFLSIMLGTTEPEDFRDELSEAEDPTLSTTHLDQPAKVHTIIDYWGAGTLVAGLDSVYQWRRFDATDAPLFIVHGDEDALVPYSEAETLAQTYQLTGAPYRLHRLWRQSHGAWDAQVNGQTLPELVFAFVVEQQALKIRE